MRLDLFICGSVLALALFAPVRADDALSLTAIASVLQAGRAGDAEAMATQMLKAPSPVPLEHAYLLLDRGLAREQLHHREAAVADFTAAINSKTLPPAELARAVFDRGVILDELGRTEEAISDYSRAIQLSPRYAAAFNNRANAYRRTGRYALARTDYEAALAAGDDEPEYPLYGLGRVAEVQGDPAAAKAYYERAVAANGMFTPASERLAGLGPVPGDGSYTLRSPETLVASTASEPRGDSAAKPVDYPKPEAAPDPASVDLGLRPAILGAQPKVRAVREAAASPASHSSPARTNDGDLVQLGAWRNQGDAALGWNRVAADAGELLNGATPDIVEADVPGKGHFWRLRTRVPSSLSADAFCAQMKAKGLNCIAVRS